MKKSKVPRNSIRILLLACLAGLLGAGCALSARRPTLSFLDAAYPKGQVKRVAVLSFENQSPWEGAEKLWRNTLISRLSAAGFEVLEPANVDKILVARGLQAEGAAESGVLEILAGRYGVDGVITGTVERFELRQTESRVGWGERGSQREVPHLSISMRMVGVNGKILWKARSEREGTDYSWAFGIGEISTPGGLAGVMADEFLEILKSR